MDNLIPTNKTKDHEEQFMNEIIVSKGENLPANIEDVINVFEFTDFKAKAWKIISNKMSTLDEQSDFYQSALRSGQQWGISALYCQKKMGEITRDMPHGRPIKNKHKTSSDYSKSDDLKKIGISVNNYKAAEQFANNPDVLDRVIESAKKRGEIPTKSAVLNTIRAEKQKEINAKAEKKSNDKLDQQRDQAVADFYEATRCYKSALKFAIIAAERNKFAPEGRNFLIKKVNGVTTLLNKLTELV